MDRAGTVRKDNFVVERGVDLHTVRIVTQKQKRRNTHQRASRLNRKQLKNYGLLFAAFARLASQARSKAALQAAVIFLFFSGALVAFAGVEATWDSPLIFSHRAF